MDNSGVESRLTPTPMMMPMMLTRPREENRIWLIRSGLPAPLFWLVKLTVA